MSFQAPLLAIKHIEHFSSTWETKVRKAHTEYIHAGCMCNHKEKIEECRSQLKGIQASYDEVSTYCLESQKDINDKAVAFRQAEKRHQDLTHDYQQNQKRMLKQMRDITLQTQGRDLFIRHVLHAQKRYHISALARTTAGYGAQFRFELEERACRQLTKKVFNIEEELASAEKDLKLAEKQWQKARQQAALIAKIQSIASANKRKLESFLLEEEERGHRLWIATVEQEKVKVAGQGLQLLICQACNGWRWHEPKASLKAYDTP